MRRSIGWLVSGVRILKRGDPVEKALRIFGKPTSYIFRGQDGIIQYSDFDPEIMVLRTNHGVEVSYFCLGNPYRRVDAERAYHNN
jgi:hypothetical protein